MNQVIVPFVGGFSGAFFALIFGQIQEGIRNKYRRWIKHYNAIIRLEHWGNEQLSIIADNRRILTDVWHACTSSGETTTLAWSEPTQLPYDPSASDDLLSMTLKYDLLGYEAIRRKMNHDIRGFISAASILRDGFLLGKIDSATYASFMSQLSSSVKKLTAGSNLIEIRCIGLLSVIRLLRKKDRPWSPILYLRNRVSIMPVDSNVKKEIIQINREIAQAAQESREESKKYDLT